MTARQDFFDGSPKPQFSSVISGVAAIYSDDAVRLGKAFVFNRDPIVVTEIQWERPVYDDHYNLTLDTDAILFVAANGQTPHATVRLATAAALPACTPAGSGLTHTLTGNANGALSVDGVAVVVSDRILVKNQASAVDNGIYAVTATGNAGAPFVLTRATAEAVTLRAGYIVTVTAGSTNAGNEYSAGTTLLSASFDIEHGVREGAFAKVLDVTAVAAANEDFTIVNQINVGSRLLRVKIEPTSGVAKVTVRSFSKAG